MFVLEVTFSRKRVISIWVPSTCAMGLSANTGMCGRSWGKVCYAFVCSPSGVCVSNWGVGCLFVHCKATFPKRRRRTTSSAENSPPKSTLWQSATHKREKEEVDQSMIDVHGCRLGSTRIGGLKITKDCQVNELICPKCENFAKN